MEHLAIMRPSWGLTQKILQGKKQIESRWYMAKRNPWDRIHKGDVVYFKDAGKPVSMRADVGNVLQFGDLTEKRVRELLLQYGKQDGIDKEKIPEFFKRFKDKKYCILVFLRNPVAVKPFAIDKTGFGSMSSWITVSDVRKNLCR